MIQISMAILKTGEEESSIYRELIQNFSLTLDSSKVYDVGIDQSTSCTGIAICPLDESFKILIEVKNENSDHYYVPQLRNFIKEILSSVKIRYFVMEEPLGYVTGRRVKVLSDLKKYLSELKHDLNVDTFTTVNVTTWRHGLMPKAGVGDRRKKETVIKTVLDLYPGFSNFLPYCNTDTDGFEALGIIIGYKARHGIDSAGGLKIVGPKNTRKSAVSFFKYVDITKEPLDKLIKKEMFIPDQLATAKGGLKFKQYNDEVNLYTNAKMSLVDTFTFTIVSDELDVLSILIRLGLTPRPDHILLMCIVHDKYVDEHMIREMYSDSYLPVLF